MSMVTMKDIAQASGVSRAVVSLVLNGREHQVGISENTRNKVLAMSKKLGYCRNELARATVTGHSRIIAFVTTVSLSRHEYISRVMGGIADKLDEREYSLKILYLKDGNEEQIIRKIRENRIAGVICHAVKHQELEILRGELRKWQIPTVTANLSADQFGIGVVSDDAAGMEQAVDYLYECGHRRLAYFGSRNEAEYVTNRRLGFERGANKHGLDARICRLPAANKFPDDFYRQADQLYQDGCRAVILETDAYAMLLMQWAYRRNIRMPDELSVIGFSNAFFTNLSVVPLTTVTQPLETLGGVAADSLLDWIDDKSANHFHEVSNIVVPVELVPRESVLRQSPPPAQITR